MSKINNLRHSMGNEVITVERRPVKWPPFSFVKALPYVVNNNLFHSIKCGKKTNKQRFGKRNIRLISNKTSIIQINVQKH